MDQSKRNRAMPVGYYNYTVVVTYLSAVAGVIGIGLAMRCNIYGAMFCLLISGALDSIDGKVAAKKKGRTRSERAFGVQIDSLCDLVNFAFLPVVIGYAFGQKTITYMGIAAVYVLGAIIRLAYFNVDEMERQDRTTERRSCYTGMPVTTVALLFPLLYCFEPLIENKILFNDLYACLMVICAALFVIPINIPKPDKKGIIALLCLGLAIFVALLLACIGVL